MKKAGLPTKGSKAKNQKPTPSKLDAEALEVIKASGILNHNVTLDQIMELTDKLNSIVEARGAFIFQDFLFRPC